MALSLELITGALSFLITLMILSYVIGDNPLFRIAVYIFVGAASGYIAAVAFWQVLYLRLIIPMITAPNDQRLLLLAPTFGAVLIIMKASPRLAGMARIVMAFLVGVGAAVTIAGAISGTLLPQIMGTINKFDLKGIADINLKAETVFNGVVILVGTVTTLAYFHFGARPKADGSMRRNGLIAIFAWVGRIFIGITLGATFAGMYAAALTALIERISSLINFIGMFL